MLEPADGYAMAVYPLVMMATEPLLEAARSARIPHKEGCRFAAKRLIS